MSDSMTVGEISALLSLSCEVAELPADPMARRRHALAGLVKLLGASSGVCFERPRHNPTQWAIVDTIVHVGPTNDPAAYAACTRALVTGQAALPVDPSAMRPSPMPYAVTRTQIVDDVTWYTSDHYRLVLKPMGVDHTLYCCVPLADGTQLCMGIHRAIGGKAFTEHDCKLVDLFHASCARLYAVPVECDADGESSDDEQTADEPDGAGDDEIGQLPPRLRAVLDLLLVGDSEKQVAFKLDLSKHTVHTYAKEIYRKLGVSSRGELLAKFIRRRPTSTPAGPTVRRPHLALAS